jgi:hypothetical protein
MELFYQLLESNWNRDNPSVRPEHRIRDALGNEHRRAVWRVSLPARANLILYPLLRRDTLLEGVLYLLHLRD